MSPLFEMRIRVGGDPRTFPEFTALRDELGKLSHPACPDVDWAQVEALCLALFHKNGADLQTVAFFALSRSQRYGLEGMTQGVALIESLSGEWSRLWPFIASVRLDILSWLFAQLQPLLRSLDITSWSVPALQQLDAGLERLNEQFNLHAWTPLLTLLTLRQHVVSLLQYGQRESAGQSPLALSTRRTEPALVMPVVILPAAPMPDLSALELKAKRRRTALWLLIVMASIVLAAGLAGQQWLARQEPQPVLPAPIHVDSLSLFNTGSAELKPGSTKVLIKALVGIKAKPGWLIVIAGHTDSSGDAERNLRLSHARASAVRDWMQRMGDIADSCFVVQGFAANQPLTANDSELGRNANRRVDIQLVPQAGACG
ncbi:OmpA family protein [Pseudomonas sp. SIMBA_077]